MQELAGLISVGVRTVYAVDRKTFGALCWDESFATKGYGDSYEAAFADADRRGTGYKDETATTTGREG